MLVPVIIIGGMADVLVLLGVIGHALFYPLSRMFF